MLVSAQQAGVTSFPGAGRQASGQVKRRVVLLAGRAEAARLCRNPLVLAGLVIAAALIWWNSKDTVPQWWVWDVQIGSALLTIGGCLLMAAQLAAGRARRDGMEELYASFPAPSAARTAAQLLGLAGPLLLAAGLVGAAVIWLDMHGPVGSPSPAVLAQGLLVVALAGAIGVALGSHLPHPMAGLLAIAVLGAAEADLLLPSGAPVQLPGGTGWLFPWVQPWVLGALPGPVPMIPPTAHLAWLGALTALAAIVAVWRRLASRRSAAIVALVGAGTVVLAGWSGWTETRPLPPAEQESLVSQVTDAARSQSCLSRQRVWYCVYPQYQPDVARWSSVVDGVLDRLPAFPAAHLVIRQVVNTDFVAYPLYFGAQSHVDQLTATMDRYLNRQATDPRLVPGSSTPPVYVDLSWGEGGSVGSYQIGLALQTAWWVAGLPTTWSPAPGSGFAAAQTSCLPVGQAREAIALWLAGSATPATLAAFPALLDYSPVAMTVNGNSTAGYVGVPSVSGYAPALQFTAEGGALAEAMLRLPESRVSAVLSARWPGWLRASATDAELAAALDIPLPPAPIPSTSASPPGRAGFIVHSMQRTDPECQ